VSSVALRQPVEGTYHLRKIAPPVCVRDALAEIPILRAAGAQTLDLLADGAEFVSVPSGNSIFERESLPTGLFLVYSGAVRLMALGPDGRARVVEIFEPGGMFGELGVFTGQRYRTWTQAVGRTVLIHVPCERVVQAVAIDNPLSNRMLSAVCARIQRLVDSIGCTSSGGAAARVASYLLELDERAARPEGPLVLPAPKNTIASLLNLTPETLSRVLRNMSDEGVLTVSGRRIRIRSRTQLRRMTAADPGAAAG